MFIVVEHAITDPGTFFALASKAAEAPAGIKALQFLPSTSSDRAVCLWEAKSVEAVKGFLEPLSAKASRNTYYGVDSTKAMGLPAVASAA